MKVLLPNLEGDPGLADRFLNEIKVQATLDHPNIAKLHTAMKVNNQLVMVMEFVDGTSLATILLRGPLPPSAAAAYSVQVLDALAYAHARGVIHRDIKPANLMLAADGHIKLMDFGIARVQADKRLTQTGSTVGSLFYMSPEQIKGSDPDGRSDLYSLGITMYERVTGRRPFGGDSDFQIMSAHLGEAPMAPIEVIPGIPSGLSDIILMAIEKDPGARFQTAEAFRAALGHAFPEAVSATKTMTPMAVPVAIPTATMMPPPLPQNLPPTVPMTAASATPAAAPWVVPESAPRSRRGLYMALGSIVTLAVLVGAVIEGPKLMRGGKSDAQGVAASQQAVAATPVAAAPAAVPDAGPVASASPEPVANAAPVGASAPVATPAPVSARAPEQPFPPIPRPASSAQNSAPPQQVAQAVPFQQAQQAQAPTPAAQPVTAATASPELKELRDKINRVSVRGAAAQAGVRSIEQGLDRQGLGLRGDIKAASIRLDYVLMEARASLQSGDVEGARNNLQYAEGTVEKLEKFLGQ
jgi:serine/threonine-protein kinase